MDYVYSHTAVDNKVDFDPSMGDICATCPAGSFACQGCQYCSPCYKGQYSDSEGSATCTDCSVMTYTPNDSKGYTSCLDVEQGRQMNFYAQNNIFHFTNHHFIEIERVLCEFTWTKRVSKLCSRILCCRPRFY